MPHTSNYKVLIVTLNLKFFEQTRSSLRFNSCLLCGISLNTTLFTPDLDIPAKETNKPKSKKKKK